MISKLLLAGAVAGAFWAAQQSRAAEPLLTPKAQSLKPAKASVSAVNDPDLVRAQLLGGLPKSVANRHPVIAGSSQGDPNLVPHLYVAKHAIRDASGRTFEIAPLAKPAKECGPGCPQPCCAKK
jgi:hypothetical protein